MPDTQPDNEDNTTMPETLRGRNENHAKWLMRRIWERIHRKNAHFMGVIVGREGSGKSHTALKIANTIDPTFDVTERAIFDISELLDKLQSGEHKPGYFYVLDEAGVQFGRRTWQERGQVLANQALQLVRDHNLGLIFTLPRLGELDSQAQGRLQAFYEIVDKKEGEYVEGKWKWLDPDRSDETGTIYKKYPRRRHNGNLNRITRFYFTPPGAELTNPYEKKKNAFQDQFYEEVVAELRGEDPDADEGEEEQSLGELAEQILNNGLEKYVTKHSQSGEPYVNKDLLYAENGDMSHANARAVKSMIERDASPEELERGMQS